MEKLKRYKGEQNAYFHHLCKIWNILHTKHVCLADVLTQIWRLSSPPQKKQSFKRMLHVSDSKMFNTSFWLRLALEEMNSSVLRSEYSSPAIEETLQELRNCPI